MSESEYLDAVRLDRLRNVRRLLSDSFSEDSADVLRAVCIQVDHVIASLETRVQASIAAISEPTDEGKRRYPPNSRYSANDQPGNACTCKPECPSNCKGQCGCEACSEAYGDFLSSE